MLRRLTALIISALLIAGCSRDPLDIDISQVQIPPITLQRLDRDLFSLNAGNIDERTPQLRQKYGSFYDHYVMGFLARRGTTDTAYRRSVLSFVTDRDVRAAYQYAQNIYTDSKMQDVLEKVEDCARRFHYHFPDKPLPERFAPCLSGWNYAFAYMDSTLCVSLDMYLGDTAIFYKMLQYPQYQQRRMSHHYLLPDIARGWMLTEFDNQAAENTLLQHTIFYGKLYYAVNALVPGMHDSLIIGYTGKQLDYCNQYEKNLWGYFAEKNRLYENNLNTIRELIMPLDGPFTAAISKDCPPRIGMWIGWQIVRSYMKHNENVTLADLMNEQDGQKILSLSRYRP